MERDIVFYLRVLAINNFNSHAHVERDDFLWNADEKKFHFNSHAHVERDPLKSTPVLIILHFNSHAHVERDIDFKDFEQFYS